MIKMDRAKFALWLKQNKVKRIPQHVGEEKRIATYSFRIDQMKKVKILSNKLNMSTSEVLEYLVESLEGI